MADNKPEPAKAPPKPQNTGAPERPKMPENRLITGNDVFPNRIEGNNKP